MVGTQFLLSDAETQNQYKKEVALPVKTVCLIKTYVVYLCHSSSPRRQGAKHGDYTKIRL